MLILARRIDEVVRIGDDIEVVVLAVDGNQMKLGFNAPPEVHIYREEVLEKIEAQTSAP